MTLRRFVAFILSLSLLSLTSKRADSACARHGEHASQAAGADAKSAETVDHSAHAPATQDETCDAPALPDCCQALASCSLTIGGQDPRRLDTAQGGADRIVATAESAPASRVASPDPPPPRR